MDIRSVCICDNIVGGFRGSVVSEDCEIKSLPMLSVVQSTRGSYRIALGDGEPEVTGDMGVFIAPRRVTQRIWHMPRPSTATAQNRAKPSCVMRSPGITRSAV